MPKTQKLARKIFRVGPPPLKALGMLCEEIKHKFQEMHAGDRKNDFQRIFESENWSKKCHAKKNMSA